MKLNHQGSVVSMTPAEMERAKAKCWGKFGPPPEAVKAPESCWKCSAKLRADKPGEPCPSCGANQDKPIAVG